MLLKNRKFRRIMAAVLCSSMVLTTETVPASAKSVTKITKISVSNKNIKKGTLTLKKGKSTKLSVKVTPKKAIKKVKYKTSNKKIATVSKTGKVTAKQVGNCKLTVYATGSKKKCVIKVKIVKATTKPTPTKTPTTTVPTNTPTTTPTSSDTVNPSEKPTATPTATPAQTTNPAGIKINGKNVIVKSVSSINNTDFTFTITAKLEDGTNLKDIMPSAVQNAFQGSTVILKKEDTDIQLEASFVSYSNDKDSVTYKINNTTTLQPSKNNGNVGSADGRYLITSPSLSFSEKLYASYNEALMGNSVSGYIYARGTKTPLKNATVTAYTSDNTKTVKTDANGHYTLPLSSGTYKIVAKAEKKEGYFSSQATAKVNTNNKTACNLYIDTYNKEELFITGSVKSGKDNAPLENATVSLVEISQDGTTKKLATVTTSEDGIYLFQNSKADTTSDYKDFLLANSLENSTLATKIFPYNKGLDRKNTYKIVISKKFSETNLTDAHETQEIQNVKFTDDRHYDAGITKLKNIEGIKSFNISAKWNCALPELDKTSSVSTTVKFCSKDDNGHYVPIVSKTVKFKINSDSNQSDNYSLTENSFFAKEYPTIPAGRYYLLLDDNTASSALTVASVDIKEGEAVDVNFAIAAAKSTSVNTNCSVMNKVSVSNFVDKKPVYVVTDVKGTLKTDGKNNVSIQPKYTFYRKIGDDLIQLSNVSANLTYTAGNTAKITASTGISRTEENGEYVIIPVQSYIYGDASVPFVQSAKDLNEISYSCSGAANINTIKLKSASQFKTSDSKSLTSESKVIVEYIALYDETGKKLSQYDCLNRSYRIAQLTSTGIPVPATEIGFKGLKPSDLTKDSGKYKIGLKIKDYDEVSTTVAVTDFQDVTVTQTSNINYTQKTTLCGNLSIENSVSGDVQDADADTIDALLTLYDKNGTIVGVSTYGNKMNGTSLERNYSFVNGENAYLEEEGEYTLVIRSVHHNDAYAFETCVKKINIVSGKKIEENIALQGGSNGSVTISATDEKNNYLENANIVLHDDHYVDLLTMDYVPGYNIYETLSSVDPTLIGIYSVPATSSKKEWVAKECIPKGTYQAIITSYRTKIYTLDNITIASGQHWISTNNLIPLIAGEDVVKINLKYAHQLAAGLKSPFEMVCIYDEAGQLVAEKEVFSTNANTSEKLSYQNVSIYVPNKAGKYSVVVYSNGSFLNTDTITLQGIDKELEVKLVQSSVVG